MHQIIQIKLCNLISKNENKVKKNQKFCGSNIICLLTVWYTVKLRLSFSLNIKIGITRCTQIMTVFFVRKRQ